MCRRCNGNVIDDAHHLVFNCDFMDSICRNPSLFISGSRSSDVYMVRNPVEVAAFAYECKRACLAMSYLSCNDCRYQII